MPLSLIQVNPVTRRKGTVDNGKDVAAVYRAE